MALKEEEVVEMREEEQRKGDDGKWIGKYKQWRGVKRRYKEEDRGGEKNREEPEGGGERMRQEEEQGKEDDGNWKEEREERRDRS